MNVHYCENRGNLQQHLESALDAWAPGAVIYVLLFEPK